GRFLVPPAGATRHLATTHRSPAVPRRYVPVCPTVPLVSLLPLVAPLSGGQRPCSLANATRQHIHGGVLVAVQDEPTAWTDMRPHAKRLPDARWARRPIGQDAATVLAGVLRWNCDHCDSMQLTIVLHPAPQTGPAHI